MVKGRHRGSGVFSLSTARAIYQRVDLMTDAARTQRESTGRYGAFLMWSQVPNRTERTRKMRENSPSHLDYWLNRQDPEAFADSTQEQREQAAEAARRAYYQRLAMKSAQVRSARSKGSRTEKQK